MYSQPQQSVSQPNRMALWVNAYKQNPNQPDYKGNVEITYELAQELLAAFSAGKCQQDRAGRACIKLDVAIYAQQMTGDPKRPIMAGVVSTVAETDQAAAMRQQRAAERQAEQGGYPQQQAPMAQPQYQQPAPALQGQPQQPAQAYQQPPAPQPMPQQQPPAPVYQQAPAQPAPLAPPMAGAIHGQPPAQSAPQLPQGF
jgi:hypothetical protein